MIKKEDLIREYVTALRNKSASVFIGAGLSYPVFNKGWKDLITPYAQKIGLKDKDLGNDYPFVAQAYVNNGNDELCFRQEICNLFKSTQTTSVHEILAKLPIHNYWTTNYDTLLENALICQKKHFDLIYDNDSFVTLHDRRDHIVYKCHGDYAHPKSIVITQKDYENYRFSAFNFTHALYNELATSSVLFLGYSLNDPDINSIIATLTAVNNYQRKHYLITKKDKREKRKQELWAKNLERYGIYTTLIDDYNEVEFIVKEIEKRYMAYNILISGSAIEYSQYSKEELARELIYKLGYKLVESDCSGSNVGHGLKIINGNGFGIGPYLYEGVAEAAATYGLDMADYLLMYPFPKAYYEKFEKDKPNEEKYQAYREKMISKCGAVFFIFGNKIDENGLTNAAGVKKEFEIAVKNGKYVFPIGATGYMAKELADIVLADFEKYNGKMPNVENILKKLNNASVPPKDIINGILHIIDAIAFRPETQ